MFKKLFLTLLLTTLVPVFAGDYDDVSKSGDKVFLYLYSPDCGYCLKANPIYHKAAKIYDKKCKFVKTDINSRDGRALAITYKANYVPFAVLIDSKSKQAMQVPAPCLLSYACTEQVMNEFTK